MENIVTLFLLFSYSTLLCVFAFKIFIYDRYRASQKLRELREKAASIRKDSPLEKVTDPVVNAQYEISRASRALRMKICKEPAEAEKPEGEGEKYDKLESLVNEGLAGKAASQVTAPAAGTAAVVATAEASPVKAGAAREDDDSPVRYELDEATLHLLIKTLSYDDFARLYEKFLHACDENEICSLVPELSQFGDDERIVMILTPLLSNGSAKVQAAVHDFIAKTKNLAITDDIVSIIENSEFNRRASSFPKGPFSGQAADRPEEDYESVAMSLDRGIYDREPHELVHEAYNTSDRDRLFEISCALSAYDDPLVVETQLYINSVLDGEKTARKEALKQEAAAPTAAAGASTTSAAAGNVIRAEAAPVVKKYEFTSIDDVFDSGARGVRMKTPKKEEQARPQGKKTDHPNDYVRGMKLVNTAKYGTYEEFFPEFSGALAHHAPYLRCCAIMAMKTMAHRYFNREGEGSAEYMTIKGSLLSHMSGERNTEVGALCARALAEMENFVRQTPEELEGRMPGVNTQAYISRGGADPLADPSPKEDAGVAASGL